MLSVLQRLKDVQRFCPLAILCLAGVGFFLRLYRLEAQSLRGDEILGIIAAQKPFADMFASEALVDHPPLYFLLLRLWLAIAGDSDFAVRFLSVGFGTLTVLVVYQIGRRLFEPSVGLLAGTIATISPLSVVYGQEARAYALALLFATISVYLLLLLIERGDRRSWLLWPCFSLLAVFSEYVGGLVIAFGEIFLLLFLLLGRLSGWRYWLSAQAIILGLLLPWLYFSQAALNVYVYDSAAWGMNLGEMLRETAIRFSVGHSLSGQAEMFFTGTFVGIAALGLLHSRRDMRSFLFSAGYLIVPIATTYAISLGILGFAARHLLVIIPAFFLLLACGLAWLRRRSWPLSALGMAIVVTASGASLLNYYHDPAYAREDLRGVAHYIEEVARPNDIVVFTAPWGEKMFRYYSDAPVQTIGLPVMDKKDQSYTTERLGKATAGHDRVWLVLYLAVAADPLGTVEKWLDKQTYPLGARGFSGVAVRSFLANSPMLAAPPIVQHSVDETFGDKLQLLGYDVDDAEAATKGRLYVTLYWQGVRPMNKSYRVQVRVVDGAERVWASRDNRPVMDTLPTVRWPEGIYIRDEYDMELLPGTPPGKYRISVSVYDPSDAQPLTLARGIGHLVAGEVEVPRRTVPPSPDRYKIQVRAPQDFGEIELVGYSVWGRGSERGTNLQVRAGDKLTVSTLWRARTSPQSNVALSLRLEGQGQTLASAKEPIGGNYPSTRWRAGEMIRDFQTLTIDPELPEGSYRLLALVGERGQIALGAVDVKSIPRRFAASAGAHKVGDSFGRSITLLGYDITPATDTPLKRGSKITLTLFWKAEKKVAVHYTIFTHLVDAHERIVGQHDGEPGQGQRPTTGWLPGEVVDDRHDLVVAPDATPGIHRVFVGLYDAQTGQRLPLIKGGDRLLLDEVQVDGDHVEDSLHGTRPPSTGIADEMRLQR